MNPSVHCSTIYNSSNVEASLTSTARGMDEDTVVLTCRFETCDVFYMCSVNNQSLPNSMELELCKGNRTLTVFNVKRHDTGPCVREAGDPENVTHDDPSTQNGLSE